MLSVGAIRLCKMPRNCVATSPVEPVTPAPVAIAANRLSMLTPRLLANGATAPMLPASSGNVVCPIDTVICARSATCCTAPADVSP